MIKVEHLSKHYGATQAVNDISFEVTEGENLVLLGTSGCGKTTTLKMLNRLIEPGSGQIFINGKNITLQKPEILRRSIGYVLQNNGLFPHYTVAQNMAVVPQLLKWDKQHTLNRAQQLLEKLHLPANLLSQYPHQLSGGQQQRVGLARALMADAPVLLMDEPFGALDNITRASIQAEFKALDDLQRKTIVMVTHDVQEAFELGNHIAIMDKGRIVQLGTPAELLFKPANAFVQSFLQSQRLQLELKTVTLEQVCAFWPAKADANTAVKVLQLTDSVWQAMEILKGNLTKNIAVHQAPNGNTCTADFTQLMNSYHQYQQQYLA